MVGLVVKLTSFRDKLSHCGVDNTDDNSISTRSAPTKRHRRSTGPSQVSDNQKGPTGGWLQRETNKGDETEDSEEENLVDEFLVEDSFHDSPTLTAKEGLLDKEEAPPDSDDSIERNWFMPPKLVY